MSAFEVWLCDPRGTRLALLDNLLNLTYANVANNPGYFSVIMPPWFDSNLIGLDNIIEIYRTATGTDARNREFVGFLRRWDISDDAITISGRGILDFLDRRIVAYASGTAYAEKTDYADDMIKAIIRENIGSLATDTDRDATGFAVNADLSAAPEITKMFSRKNVMETCQDIAEASRQNGTELYFFVDHTFDTDGYYTGYFTTRINQPGQDRTTSSDAPIFFGDQWGNIKNALLIYDYTDEVTVVYAGGQGEGENRTVVEREDTARSSASIHNRREGWRDARHVGGDDETTGLNAEGDAELADGRPLVRFTASLVDSPQALYGYDWYFGDKVTIGFRGLTYDAVIKSVQVSVGRGGKETISATVEVEL